MKLGFSGQIFEKYLNIKFQENPCIGAELSHGHRRTDMKLIDACRNFSNAVENVRHKNRICPLIYTGLVWLHHERCEHDIQSCKFLKDLFCASLLN